MTPLTSEHVDAVYDTIVAIEVACQLLSDGDVSDAVAGNLSWLLGSAGRKLSSVVGTIERLKTELEKTEDAIAANKLLRRAIA